MNTFVRLINQIVMVFWRLRCSSMRPFCVNFHFAGKWSLDGDYHRGEMKKVDHNVRVSLPQCRRACQRCLEVLDREQEYQFGRIWDYRVVLMKANSGSIIELITPGDITPKAKELTEEQRNAQIDVCFTKIEEECMRWKMERIGLWFSSKGMWNAHVDSLRHQLASSSSHSACRKREKKGNVIDGSGSNEAATIQPSQPPLIDQSQTSQIGQQ